MPAAQFDSGVAPVRHDDCVESAYDPDGQTVHVADPAPATDPAEQRAHVAAVVARRTFDAVPTRHDVHTLEPSESLYVPSRQSLQSEAFLPPNFERDVPARQN